MTFLFFVTVGMVLTFTGCDKRNEDINYSTEVSATDSGDNISVNPDGENTISTEEVWLEENITDRVSINAVVNVKDASDLKVMKATIGYMVPEERKAILTALSQEIYKADKQFHSKEQIQQYINEEKDNITLLESFEGNDTELERAYKRLAEYEAALETASDKPIVADDFENLEYRLKVDDKWYYADFSQLEYGFEKSCILFALEDYEKKDTAAYYGYAYVDITAEEAGTEADNKCNLTKEEACKEAEAFVETLNIGDFSVVSVKSIKYEGLSNMDDYVGVTWYDGYEITLNRCIDDVTVDGYTTYPDRVYLGEMNNISEFRFKTGMEAISIRIDDRGVYLAAYTNPLVITEVVSENVSVLSYESIKDIIIEELLKDETAHSYISYVNLSLVYFPLIDETETEITMIPAWRLDDSKIYGEMDNCIIINAMDGSVIDLQGRFVEVLN